LKLEATGRKGEVETFAARLDKTLKEFRKKMSAANACSASPTTGAEDEGAPVPA
jgi:hypothetical protein